MRCSLPALALAVVPAALVATGCFHPCDEKALDAVSEIFEDNWGEERHAGFEALGKACPGLPPSVGISLTVAYGRLPSDLRIQRRRELQELKAHIAITDAFCKLDEAQTATVAGSEDHVATFRELCKIDEGGPITPDEPFEMADTAALVMHHWMVNHGVAAAPARRLARSLMVAGANEAQLARRCAENDKNCARWIESIGIELPTSNSDSPSGRATPIFFGKDAISTGTDELLATPRGKAAEGAFERHVSPALLAHFEKQATDAREQAKKIDFKWDPAWMLIAGKETASGLIIDTAFSASRAGFSRYDIGVRRGSDMFGHRVRTPFSWSNPDTERERGRARPTPPRFTVYVHADSVQLTNPKGEETRVPVPAYCLPEKHPCFDAAPLAAFTKLQLADTSPYERLVAIVADRDVPLQLLVSVMDAMGGVGCPSHGFGNFDEDCEGLRATLDSNPPLYWDVDRLDELVLTKVMIGNQRLQRSPNYRAGDKLPAQIQAKFDAAKEKILACVSGDAALLASLRGDDPVWIHYGPHPDRPDDLVARAGALGMSDLSSETEKCMLDALGVEAGPPGFKAYLDLMSDARVAVAFTPRYVERTP